MAVFKSLEIPLKAFFMNFCEHTQLQTIYIPNCEHLISQKSYISVNG